MLPDDTPKTPTLIELILQLVIKLTNCNGELSDIIKSFAKLGLVTDVNLNAVQENKLIYIELLDKNNEVLYTFSAYNRQGEWCPLIVEDDGADCYGQYCHTPTNWAAKFDRRLKMDYPELFCPKRKSTDPCA